MVSKVDLALLAASLGVLLLALQQEGDLALVPAWSHALDPSTFANAHGPDLSETPPAPLVTDLDGDGINEVIIATREPKLLILKGEPAPPEGVATRRQRLGEWQAVKVLREASLLTATRVRHGRQVVALAAGYLHPYSDTDPRQQFIAAVTEGWSILLFNAQLELLWERAVDAEVENSFISEIALSVTPHDMKTGDMGAVIVGGRVTPRSDEQRMYTMSSEKGVREEGEEERLLVGRDHFSIYAFEGATGALRWRHQAGDFVPETHADDLLFPAHEHHAGEMDWRAFRYSMLNSLPHQWNSRADTAFALAHFERRRTGKGRARGLGADKPRDALPSEFRGDLPFGGLLPHSDDDHIREPNALVAHLRDGVEVLHLFSGRPICKLSLKHGAAHADVDGDGVVDHIEALAGVNTPLSRSRAMHHGMKVPRCIAVVTSGVPPRHTIFNGTICARKSLRRALKRSVAAMQLAGAAGIEEESDDDVLVAQPALLPAYPTSRSRLAAVELGKTEPQAHTTQVVGAERSGRRFNAAFLVNSGTVTAYSHKGALLWQRATAARWSLDEEAGDNRAAEALNIRKLSLHPSLTPFRLRAHGHKDHLLALGEDHGALVTAAGDVRCAFELPDLPVAAPVVGDFNNDGWSDVVVTGTHGVYGLVLERRVGTKLFTLLAGTLLVLLLVAFAVNASADLHKPTHTRSVGSAASALRLDTAGASGLTALSRAKAARLQD